MMYYAVILTFWSVLAWWWSTRRKTNFSRFRQSRLVCSRFPWRSVLRYNRNRQLGWVICVWIVRRTRKIGRNCRRSFCCRRSSWRSCWGGGSSWRRWTMRMRSRCGFLGLLFRSRSNTRRSISFSFFCGLGWGCQLRADLLQLFLLIEILNNVRL